MEAKHAIVLAAGKGTRMPSQDKPKVLYEVCGVPMVKHVVDTLEKFGVKPVVVVGYKAEEIKKVLGDNYTYVFQDSPLGTGHAVMAARPVLEGKPGLTYVVCGDMPLWTVENYRKLFSVYNKKKSIICFATVFLGDEYKYGRIVRRDGEVVSILEDKNCTVEQKKIRERNAGLYLFDNGWLWKAIGELEKDDFSGEYYFTDIIKIAVEQGKSVEAVEVSAEEALGVNTAEQLREVERAFLERGRDNTKFK